MLLLDVGLLILITWTLFFIPVLLWLFAGSSFTPASSGLFAHLSDAWLIEGLAIVACGLGIVLKATPRVRVRMPTWSWTWTLWIAWAILSLLWSVDRASTVRVGLAFFSWGLMGVIACTAVFQTDRLAWWCRCVGVICLVVAVDGLKQYFTWSQDTTNFLPKSAYHSWPGAAIAQFVIHKRIFGIFGWPNVFASFLLLMLPVLRGLQRHATIVSERVFWTVAMVVSVCALLATCSVTAWCALAMTCALVIGMRSRRVVPWVVVGALLCGGVALVAWQFAAELKPMFEASLKSRLFYLHAAFQMITDHPVLGTGLGSFARVYLLRLPSGSLQTTGHAHNTLMEVTAELGVIGLCLLLCLLYKIWHLLVRTIREQGRLSPISEGVAIGLLACWLHGLFEWTWIEAMVAPLWWMMLGWVSAPSSRPASLWEQRLIGWTCVIGLIIALRLAMADGLAGRADALALNGRLTEAHQTFTQASRWDVFSARYADWAARAAKAEHK